MSLGVLCKSANTRKDLNAPSILSGGPFGNLLSTGEEGRWQKDGDPLVINSSLLKNFLFHRSSIEEPGE